MYLNQFYKRRKVISDMVSDVILHSASILFTPRSFTQSSNTVKSLKLKQESNTELFHLARHYKNCSGISYFCLPRLRSQVTLLTLHFMWV